MQELGNKDKNSKDRAFRECSSYLAYDADQLPKNLKDLSGRKLVESTIRSNFYVGFTSDPLVRESYHLAAGHVEKHEPSQAGIRLPAKAMAEKRVVFSATVSFVEFFKL